MTNCNQKMDDENSSTAQETKEILSLLSSVKHCLCRWLSYKLSDSIFLCWVKCHCQVFFPETYQIASSSLCLHKRQVLGSSTFLSLKPRGCGNETALDTREAVSVSPLKSSSILVMDIVLLGQQIPWIQLQSMTISCLHWGEMFLVRRVHLFLICKFETAGEVWNNGNREKVHAKKKQPWMCFFVFVLHFFFMLRKVWSQRQINLSRKRKHGRSAIDKLSLKLVFNLGV